jgi:hypothetical protein
MLDQELGKKNPFLFRDFQKIKYAAERIFEERPGIPWYTDHGLEHSARLVKRVAALVKHIMQGTHGLSGEELFVRVYK